MRRVWLSGVAAAICMVAGCSEPERSEPVPEPSLAAKESAWIAEMQLRVKSDLRDPSSAEFRNVRVSHSGGVPVVCGEVNSANAFGGKAGFQRFIAAGDIRVLEEQMEDGAMSEVWGKLCR